MHIHEHVQRKREEKRGKKRRNESRFIFCPENELGFILVSIDRFSEDKVKFERISSRIGRLLAYKWME